MIEFFAGFIVGLAICIVFARYISVFFFTFSSKCDKIYKSKNSIKKEQNDTINGKNDSVEKELRAARAAIRNFYLYDGSEQRDPFEIAEDEMEKRG